MINRLANQINAGTGLIFGAFGVAAVAVGFWFPGWPPAFDSSAQVWADFYRAQRTSILVSVVLMTLALVFLTWFIVAVHSVLKANEEGPMRFSDVAFAAGIFGVGAIHVALICFTVAAFRAKETDPAMIRQMNDMAFICGVPAAAAGIAFFASLALATFRTRAFPAWLGWLAAVSAVLQAGPLGGVFTTRGPFNLKDGLFGILLVFASLGLWTVLASLHMIRRAGAMQMLPPSYVLK